MSLENAHDFLARASHSDDFRQKFVEVKNPEEFLEIARSLGYDFTTEELKEVVAERSKNIKVRRTIGVWSWLRSVKWR